MKKFFGALIWLFTVAGLYGQQFCNPLDTPMILSATFAELRPNHFHSGIDIKTNEVTGKPVRAIEAGYIYRIKISPYGFGKALYVMHYNGKTSVYGHLCCFTPEIDSIVIAEMYRKHRNSIEYFPKKIKIKVKKGEIIGYSGNSGSSQGPHLHFEVRDTKTEHPLNPLKFGFNVKDTVKPRMFDLVVYDLGNKFYQNGKYCGLYRIKKAGNVNGKVVKYVLDADTVKVPANAGFVLNVADFVNNSSSVCGVYGITLKMDGKKMFEIKFDEFSFYETRYINSVMDYPLYKLEKKRRYRLFKQPGNKLSFMNKSGSGIVKIDDNNCHNIEITVYDIYENFSVLEFVVQKDTALKCDVDTKDKILLSWKKSVNTVKGENFEFDIQGKSLYDDAYVSFTEDSDSRFLSPVIKFGDNSTIPLHKRNVLKIKPFKPVPGYLQPKVTIVKVDGRRIYDAGGYYTKSGYVTAKVREFADYAVTVDTVKPFIKPLNIYTSKNMSSEQSIVFKATDDLTGIGGYKCYIDGKWTRVDYDIKDDKMYCMFREVLKQKTGEEHSIIFTVIDEKGNSGVYKTKFVY